MSDIEPSATDPSANAAAPPPQLTPIEARVVAVLIEKEATTPDVYPLTLNAIVVACNQKTSRDPVTHLEQGDVAHALRQLEPRGWVKSHHSPRAERYGHRAGTALDATRPQTVLLALLMLRGPQTANELLSRSERMAKFESAGDVQYALERLSQHQPPLVKLLGRQSGQREDRYGHLLCGEPEWTASASGADPTLASPAAQSALTERIAALEAKVAELEARLEAAGA
ncbi:YceH family protein [Lysobacter enzymogenes]|uniref:YceH family protein n=1 Tax=Lysobacter enzymogenes TaxID=69 RepID=UPI001A979F4B|nr:YceH family protein [Lysobacter enzymogenes]QQP98473.1 YceH family protein [Lysobacter enzymogenes]